MWVVMLVVYLVTIVISAVVGSRAKVRFIQLLREHHWPLYEKLGEPPVYVNTSFMQGVAVQRVVFGREPGLSPETEAARRHLRFVTVAIVTALVIEVILMIWAFGAAVESGSII